MSKQQSFDLSQDEQSFDLSQDEAILASLALPRNPLAGAVFAGHHLWWKGQDVAKELTRVDEEEEAEKASFLQYGTSSSLSDMSQGLRAEMAWNSGGTLKEDKRYLGLQTIGSKANAEKYLETIFGETIPWIVTAAKTSRDLSGKLLGEYLGSEQNEIMVEKTLETMLKDTKTAEDALFEAYGTTQVKELKILTEAQDAVIRAFKRVAADGDIFTKALEESTEEATFPETELENYKNWLNTYKDTIAALQKQITTTGVATGKKVRGLEEDISRLQVTLATAEKIHLKLLAKRIALSTRFKEYVEKSRKRRKDIRDKIEKKMQTAADEAAVAAEEHSGRLAGMLEDCEARLAEFDLKREKEASEAEAATATMEQLLEEVEKEVKDKETEIKQCERDGEESVIANSLLTQNAANDRATIKRHEDEIVELQSDIQNTRGVLREQVEASENLLDQNIKLRKLVAAQKRLGVTKKKEIVQDAEIVNEVRTILNEETQETIVVLNEIKNEEEKIEELEQELEEVEEEPTIITILPKPGSARAGILNSWIFPKTQEEAIESVFHMDQRYQKNKINLKEVKKDLNKFTLWSLMFDPSGPNRKESFKNPPQSKYMGDKKLEMGKSIEKKPGKMHARDTTPKIFYASEDPVQLHIEIPSRFITRELRGKDNKWPYKINGPHVLIGFSAYLQILKKDKTPSTSFFTNLELKFAAPKPKDKQSFQPVRWSLQLRKDGISGIAGKDLADKTMAYEGTGENILDALKNSENWGSVKANVTRVYLHTNKKVIQGWTDMRQAVLAESDGKSYKNVAQDFQNWLLENKQYVSFVTDTNLKATEEDDIQQIIETKLPNDSGKWLRQTRFTATPEFW